MHLPSLIEKKRDDGELSTSEIAQVISGFTRGEIPDYQISALAMAIFFRGMSDMETWYLTKAMLESGQIFEYPPNTPPKVDKHSTGAIGGKTSLVLAPLLACDDLWVPMISGRGLDITGGTLDKLESIPGFNVNLDRTVGNALELAEAIDVLHGQGPPDVVNLVLDLATKVANVRRAQLQKWLQDGSAWKKFISLVEAQDGSASVLEEIAAIYKAPITHEIRSDRAGKITAMDAEKIGRASFLLGGGRQQVDDKIDLAVGISDLKKIGESVQRDEPLMRVHARTNEALEQVLPLLRTVAVIGDECDL